MPSVTLAAIVGNTTSRLPAADRVKGIGQATDSFGKLGADVNRTFVESDSIADSSFILHSIGEIGKCNVKFTITLYRTLVHADRRVELSDILEKAAEIGVEVGVMLVEL